MPTVIVRRPGKFVNIKMRNHTQKEVHSKLKIAV